jgi:hypothetical protein
MSILCYIGIHSWDGCKCKNCGKTRDENHSWKKDNCSICEKCGKVYEENHLWDGCKCSQCRKTRDEQHSWDGCKCLKCGKTRNENHSWKKDDCSICEKCGKVNAENHSWDAHLGTCKYCGKNEIINIMENPDPKGVDFQEIKDLLQKLNKIPSDIVIPALIELLTNGPIYARWRAAYALGEIGDRLAIDPIIEYLRSPYKYEDHVGGYSSGCSGRTDAIKALSKLDSYKAVPILIEMLNHLDWMIRFTAVEVLGNIGDKRAGDGLVKLLNWKDEDTRICNKAFEALKKIFGNEVNNWCLSRSDTHKFINCTCTKCGIISHNWVHGKCSSCGKIKRFAFGQTELHYAIEEKENIERIRALCQNGLANIGDDNDFTPLMFACGPNGGLEIVKLLISFGADINTKSKRLTTALSMATLHGKQDIIDYLIDHDAKDNFTIRKW